MWVCVVVSWCMVDTFYLWNCVESVIFCHEGTDALAEVNDLDTYLPQEGVACPLTHYFDCFRVHFGQIEFHGKPWPNGVGAHLFVWKSQSLFAKGKCAWPKIFVRGDCCLLMLYPERVYWYVTCCSRVWVQLDDDFCLDEHWAEGCGRPPLCHCGIFDPVFLCVEFWGDLIGQMEDNTVVWKLEVFYVKSYIPFLKDAYAFVLPFRSCWLIARPHAEKNTPAISWLMAVFRCVFVRLNMWRNRFSGIYFWCFVVGSSVL